MPMTTTIIMPQFMCKFVSFNDYINMHSLALAHYVLYHAMLQCFCLTYYALYYIIILIRKLMPYFVPTQEKRHVNTDRFLHHIYTIGLYTV